MIANRHMRICCVASAPLIAFVLIFAPSVSPAHAVEDARKVSVVSFGLFGDQGVFKSEATGAAQVVASRFGNGPIKVQYNSKKGGGATIEGLATSLQVASNGMDAENDVLFLILTSHGSRAGLAVKAGRLTQTLTPSNLADMLARTGMRLSQMAPTVRPSSWQRRRRRQVRKRRMATHNELRSDQNRSKDDTRRPSQYVGAAALTLH